MDNDFLKVLFLWGHLNINSQKELYPKSLLVKQKLKAVNLSEKTFETKGEMTEEREKRKSFVSFGKHLKNKT